MTGKRKKYTEEEKEGLSREAQQQRNQQEDCKLGGFKKIYPLSEEQVKKYKRFFQYSHEMEGLSVQNGFGTMSASTIVPSEKKVEMQKQLLRTYQLQPTESLRKNSSAKLGSKGRESNPPSHCKPSTSKHNLSTDKLTLDVHLDNSVDLKKNRV